MMRLRSNISLLERVNTLIDQDLSVSEAGKKRLQSYLKDTKQLYKVCEDINEETEKDFKVLCEYIGMKGEVSCHIC